MTEKTFIKVTNNDIYKMIEEHHKVNEKQHEEIIRRLDVTNGKVKLSKWVATTALAMALIVLGYLFNHLSR